MADVVTCTPTVTGPLSAVPWPTPCPAGAPSAQIVGQTSRAIRRWGLGVALAACLLASAPGPAVAQSDDSFPTLDVRGLVDARVGRSDDVVSWTDFGTGKLRYGADREDGATTIHQLGEAALVAIPRIRIDTVGVLHLQHVPDLDPALDVVEAFVRYRPVSTGRVRYSGRVGAFFPPLSLENTSIAWTSPYTLTPSAINSWIGEDVRAIGGEVSGEVRLDAAARTTVTATGGLFFGNDPAGTVLSSRGWALHDRKTGLFGSLELPANSQLPERELRPFVEIDDRPGGYLNLDLNLDDLGEVTVTAYDNFADNTQAVTGARAWRTRFLAAGYAVEVPAFGYDVDLITQAMIGDTSVNPDGPALIDVDFASAFVLGSVPFTTGPVDHRISVRYDVFDVTDRSPDDLGAPVYDESGFAVTGSYGVRFLDRHRLTAEVVHVDSVRAMRGMLGGDDREVETLGLLSYRFYF